MPRNEQIPLGYHELQCLQGCNRVRDSISVLLASYDNTVVTYQHALARECHTPLFQCRRSLARAVAGGKSRCSRLRQVLTGARRQQITPSYAAHFVEQKTHRVRSAGEEEGQCQVGNCMLFLDCSVLGIHDKIQLLKGSIIDSS
jgi:hypothetical protein